MANVLHCQFNGIAHVISNDRSRVLKVVTNPSLTEAAKVPGAASIKLIATIREIFVFIFSYQNMFNRICDSVFTF